MNDQSSPRPVTQSSTAALPAIKQAVVIIHGMGGQRPMDTIKDFVKAVWQTD
jgi:hypothetical protein